MMNISLNTAPSARVLAARQRYRLRLFRSTAGGLRIAAFLGALATLGIAFSPALQRASEQYFACHMVQHELLMLVAAPMIVLAGSVPLTLCEMVLPRRIQLLKRALAKIAVAARNSRSLPLAAWLLHAVVLWVWHAPALFQAAIHNEAIHVVQHASFFGTALLFWWALALECRNRRYGAGIAYVFTTGVHSSILGALLAFSTSPWYGYYASRTYDTSVGPVSFLRISPFVVSPLVMSPLQDQQLGGLIMWVPFGTILVVVGLLLASQWIEHAGSRPLESVGRMLPVPEAARNAD